jgi:hypothetical protein
VVSNSSVLASNVLSTDTTITVEDSVFSVDEIVVLKDGINEEHLLITDISSAPTYTVTRDWGDQYLSGETLPTWNSGTAVVGQGKGASGDLTGYVVIDSVSQYSPFVDVVNRNSTTYNDTTLEVRMGNLAGVTDADFGGGLSGFGLYATNVYLKGSLFAPEIKTAISGRRIELNTDGLFAFDEIGTKMFAIYLTDVSGDSGAGDITIGNVNSENYMKWDESLGTFFVRGNLVADDIYTGTLTGIVIQGNVIRTAATGARVELDENGLTTYDDSSHPGIAIFQAIVKGPDVGDVIMGDFDGGNGVKWDNSDSSLVIKGAVTANTGPRVEILPDANTGLVVYDNDGTEVFKALVGGADVGDIIMGDISTAYAKWDNSTNKFIVADIESPDYVASTTGYKLSASAGLEVNTGNIIGSVIVTNTVPVDRILNFDAEVFGRVIAGINIFV